MFNKCGQLIFDPEKYTEEKVMEVALESGAEDVAERLGAVEVMTGMNNVYQVREAFERVGMHPVSAGLGFVPKSTVKVAREDAAKLLQLLETIEDHDDIQKVHANFDIDEQVLAELSNK